MRTNCDECVNKNNRCFCPPEYECTAYKRQPKILENVFKFETTDEWKPGESACWIECPFSGMIKLGERCRYIKYLDLQCPFLEFLQDNPEE